MKVKMIIMSLLLAFTLCNINNLRFLQDKPSKPPINPAYYIQEWDIYTMSQHTHPPEDPEIKGNYRLKSHGTTYYDWSMRSMLQVYDDWCVPIVSPAVDEGFFQFSCKYLNINNITYLIIPNYDKRPKCCKFVLDRENPNVPFHPPNPNAVAEEEDTEYVGDKIFGNGEEVEYWTTNQDPQVGGPFYYGWYKNVFDRGYRAPAAFAFATVPPEDFTHQTFYNFQVVRPKPNVFTLPEECQEDIKVCDIFDYPPENLK
jgi:hypothetical protein